MRRRKRRSKGFLKLDRRERTVGRQGAKSKGGKRETQGVISREKVQGYNGGRAIYIFGGGVKQRQYYPSGLLLITSYAFAYFNNILCFPHAFCELYLLSLPFFQATIARISF